MSGARIVEPPREDRPIEVSRADLLAAWAVLENLAVSIDQIGGSFGDPTGSVGDDRRRVLLDALASYLNEDLIRSIGDARARLGRYVPDAKAEALVDSIPYWDYADARA